MLRAMTLPRVQPIAPTWRKDPFDPLKRVMMLLLREIRRLRRCSM
jgi:hypothetical protein